MAMHPFEFIVIEVSDDLRSFSTKERQDLLKCALDHDLTAFDDFGANMMPNYMMETEVLRVRLSVVHLANDGQAAHAG